MSNVSLWFSVWLVPTVPDRKILKKIIQDFSKAHESLAFPPHMTLFCGKTFDLEKAKNKFKSVVEKESPYALTVDTVQASTAFYKTLFLTFQPEEKLHLFSDELKKQLDPNSNYTLQPHVSLLYSHMPFSEKRALIPAAKEALQELKTIHFDRIQFMTGSTAETFEAIKGWKCVVECWL